MRRVITSFLIVFVFLMGSISTYAGSKKRELKEFKLAQSATAELFVMNPNALGGPSSPRPICGAWNIAKVPGGYELFTAAHCIDIDDYGEATEPIRFGVAYNGAEHPVIIPAIVVALGNKSVLAEDLALLYVKTGSKHEILKLSDETPKLLDPVINWSASFGAIMQASEGYVSSPVIDRDGFDNSYWVTMNGVYKGSSGTAIISVKTGKVIEMCNVGVALKGFTGVRSARMKVFLSENIITSLPVTAVAPPVHKKQSEDDADEDRGDSRWR